MARHLPTQYPPELLPPLQLMRFVLGEGNFRAYEGIGQRFLEHLKDVCGLQPDEQVLEVGSGVGRMAVPLVSYVSVEARYEGFDIIPDAVRWCTEHITSQHPNFRFALADLHNEYYNPTGSATAEEFTFPYADGQFDLVFLTSVFTHLLPAGVTNYLGEIRRVLKDGGRCLATFYLFDDETLKSIESGKAAFAFPHDRGVYRTQTEVSPEEVVAYRQDFVLDLYDKTGLVIRPPIYLGSWTGREKELDFQDTIVADRA